MITALVIAGVSGSFLAGYALGRRTPRVISYRATEPAMPGAGPFRSPATNGRARSVEVGVLPPGGYVGPVLLQPGPETFKTTCGNCGGRFAYRLADVRDDYVRCPQCEKPEVHVA